MCPLLLNDGGGRKELSASTRREASSDRKSTRLNSSHSQISYAVFCLKKKKQFINVHDPAIISTQKLLYHLDYTDALPHPYHIIINQLTHTGRILLATTV